VKVEDASRVDAGDVCVLPDHAALSGRRGVDPVEAAQITGHSLAVWTKPYARSFGKVQRDEARARLLAHGFGAQGDETQSA
jgi:hypothetical protein